MKTAKRSGRAQPATKKQPKIKPKGKMSNGFKKGQTKHIYPNDISGGAFYGFGK